MLSLLVAIAVCYTIFGIKTNLRDNYNLAPFCSIGNSIFWQSFQKDVKNGKTALIKDLDCDVKCAGSSLIFSQFCGNG